ncbi:hypothetical protein RRF57_011515 [Xylaria bambusicola]|uniref:Uncharacterized protein n=1 Tax=Xylaria bambusicola TaxID=326684 RepID=A0AAN7UV27_9PEZI
MRLISAKGDGEPICLALASIVYGQCGFGTSDATMNGAEGAYIATKGSEQVYAGSDYYRAIQSALESIESGQRVTVFASGSIGESSINIDSGKIFEGCGTIDVRYWPAHGAIESLGTTNVQIPYLSLTGNPYFGLWFYGVTSLALGEINMALSNGLGIRFERDEAANRNVSMGTITVTGAGSHAVETWNIDGLTIGSVIARDVGEGGLLLQTTTNAQVGLVDGDNVATGIGYVTFRMVNNNGQLADGSYTPNVWFRVVAGVASSASGGAVISEVDLADNENNAILIENCYGVEISSGAVKGGSEVHISARDEFENMRDVSITLTVNSNTVRESPCGENISWTISGDATQKI